MADASSDPTDLVIDYELLNNAAAKLDGLESDVNTIGKIGTVISYGFVPSNSPGGGEYADNLGPEPFGRALSNFYGQWQDPLSNAGDQIKKLSATFKGVAQAYFDADASQVGAINAGIALSNARNYPAEVAAYVKAMAEWEKLPNGGVNVPYYDINGNEHFENVPQPTPVAYPGTTYSGPGGATTTWSTGGPDPDDPTGGPLVTSETTTYTVDGMTYTETTNFGPDQGWHDGGPVQNTTTTVTHSDGSTDTITTDYDSSTGNATTTDVNVSNGTTTTSEQTRSGWDGSWNTVPPPPPPPDAAGDSPHYQK